MVLAHSYTFLSGQWSLTSFSCHMPHQSPQSPCVRNALSPKECETKCLAPRLDMRTHIYFPIHQQAWTLTHNTGSFSSHPDSLPWWVCSSCGISAGFLLNCPIHWAQDPYGPDSQDFFCILFLLKEAFVALLILSCSYLAMHVQRLLNLHKSKRKKRGKCRPKAQRLEIYHRECGTFSLCY